MMTDIAYFDYMLHKLAIDKRYLKYLSPLYLKTILLLCSPNSTHKKVAEELNKNKNWGRPYTVSSIRHLLRKATSKINECDRYAQLYLVKDSLYPCSIEELWNIVNHYYEDTKIDE